MKAKNFIIPILFLLAVLISCNKEKSEPTTVLNESIELQDDEEIDDSNDEEKEVFELEERASNAHKILKVSSTDTVQGAFNCEKYRGYSKLSTQVNEPTVFKIEGYNFGNNQTAVNGSVTCSSKIKGITTTYPVTIISWDTTKISVSIPPLPDSTKNISLKFAVTKDVTTGTKTLVTAPKVKSKSVKCVGTLGGTQAGVWYGQNMWEVMLNRKRLLPNVSNVFIFQMEESTNIDSTYVPTKGDVIIKTNQDNEEEFEGVVVDVYSKDSKGNTPVRVHQRNLKCKGELKKATYKFNKSFALKTGEARAWTRFIR